MEQIEYTLVRSKRKTISIFVQRNGEVIVKAPNLTSKKYIDEIVYKNLEWIKSKQELHKKNSQNRTHISDEDIENLKIKAKKVMTDKTEYFRKIMGVKYAYVKITSAKSRWGSCSYNNSICYSYRTQLLNDEQQNYIVVHELRHILQKNHSKAFYNEIGKILPNYKQIIKSIKRFSNFDLY